MKTKYFADDGKSFDNVDECKKYENSVLKKEKERKRRAEEVNEAYKKYEELLDKYLEDYPSKYTWEDILKSFF